MWPIIQPMYHPIWALCAETKSLRNNKGRKPHHTNPQSRENWYILKQAWLGNGGNNIFRRKDLRTIIPYNIVSRNMQYIYDTHQVGRETARALNVIRWPYPWYIHCNKPIPLWLTHLGLTLFYRSPSGPIREIEGFVTHICVTREMRAVFRDAYMRHQAKMS